MKTISTLITLMLLLAYCKQPTQQLPQKQTATEQFTHLLLQGDSIYASKSSYTAFAKALIYFDSAANLAVQKNDSSMMGEAVFAKGRIYDAWNKEPQKTIAYFKEATALFQKQPSQYKRYLYAKHLVAHAYDKIKDSSNAVQILGEIYQELKTNNTFIDSIRFIPEMALISTEVHNYELADSILKLTSRSKIVNDPGTYNYLDHYYLTQSRLDAFYRKPLHSLYIDSLEKVYQTAGNLFDRMYYADNLSILYAGQNDFVKAYKYAQHAQLFTDSLNKSDDVNDMRNALLKSELLNEKRKAEYENNLRNNRNKAIWILGSMLVVITGLGLFLLWQSKKYRHLSQQLLIVNKELDVKMGEVKLLNKEIQHRVKNNLHMIYSLLQMQERKTDNEETIEHLQAASLRVESIASLHSQLLNTNGHLDFAGYIKTLIASVVNTLSDDKKVVTHINCEQINIAANNYFALSLILNEWITNSVKYAAVNNNITEINVTVKNEDKAVVILYTDNGVVDYDKDITEGLGSQIVELLSRQLRGKLSLVNKTPFKYQLSIPHE